MGCLNPRAHKLDSTPHDIHMSLGRLDLASSPSQPGKLPN